MKFTIIYICLFVIWIVVNYYYYIKKDKKHRKLLVIISILAGSVWLYVKIITAPSPNDYSCNVLYSFKEKEINKELVFKKINNLRMMRQVVVFKEINEEKFDTFYFNNEQSNTYDLITVGDTIFKRTHSD